MRKKRKKKKDIINNDNKINDSRRDNSLEFTVLRHKITVLAPFYSHPENVRSRFRFPNACSMTCVRSSCYRAPNVFAIHCKHDRFCSQVQVAMYRMQMLLHLRHLRQRCKYFTFLQLPRRVRAGLSNAYHANEGIEIPREEYILLLIIFIRILAEVSEF